jgi:hypothetical protein
VKKVYKAVNVTRSLSGVEERFWIIKAWVQAKLPSRRNNHTLGSETQVDYYSGIFLCTFLFYFFNVKKIGNNTIR